MHHHPVRGMQLHPAQQVPTATVQAAPCSRSAEPCVLCAGHLAHWASLDNNATVGRWLHSCALCALPAVHVVHGSNHCRARRVPAATLQPLRSAVRVRCAASRRRRPCLRCAAQAGPGTPSARGLRARAGRRASVRGRAGRWLTLCRRACAGRAGRTAGRGAARGRAAAPAGPRLPQLCGEPVQGRRGGGQRVLQGAGGHRADRRARPAGRAARPPPNARSPSGCAGSSSWAALGASLGARPAAGEAACMAAPRASCAADGRRGTQWCAVRARWPCSCSSSAAPAT